MVIIPLIPFIFIYVSALSVSISNDMLYSTIATVSLFLSIGTIIGKVVYKSMIRSRFDKELIGGAGVGYFLSTNVL
jgi:hypothetical protein